MFLWPSKAGKILLHLLVRDPNSAARWGLDVESDAGVVWSIPIPDASGLAKQSARADSRFPTAV